MKADALVVWWTGMKVGEPETAEIEEDTYTKCKTGSQWEPAVKHRELSSVLCDDLEGQDEGGGRSTWEGIYVYIQLIHFIVQQRLTV